MVQRLELGRGNVGNVREDREKPENSSWMAARSRTNPQ